MTLSFMLHKIFTLIKLCFKSRCFGNLHYLYQFFRECENILKVFQGCEIQKRLGTPVVAIHIQCSFPREVLQILSHSSEPLFMLFKVKHLQKIETSHINLKRVVKQKRTLVPTALLISPKLRSGNSAWMSFLHSPA